MEFKSPKMAPSLGLDSQSRLMSLPMLSNPELVKTGTSDTGRRNNALFSSFTQDYYNVGLDHCGPSNTPASPTHFIEVFSVLSGDVEVSHASKKKRVRFGAPLSPEFFDKNLPPSTPLQKGATPALPPSSTGRKHSLLKTPQRFTSPPPQPDFSSPDRNGASPVLPTTRTYSDGGVASDEVALDNRKVLMFTVFKQIWDPVVTDVPCVYHEHSLLYQRRKKKKKTPQFLHSQTLFFSLIITTFC